MTTDVEWTPKAREILAAATELFYDQGIHAVGVEAIAARAGVTKRTLYNRFESKEQLVVEYLHARDVAWRELVARHLESVGDDPRARLATIFDATREWMIERSPKGCSMINAHAEISDPAHPAYPIIIGQKRWMLELFTAIARDAGVEEPAVTGERLLMTHEGALVTGGMGVVADAYDAAGAMAMALLDAG
ncbi:helix-turn-helix domain-containing protein [Gordonia sp. CPCC 205515]|uniref:TetR/AcrR family transcriptional regulator n=1 Tax=Gordonia sp. CPCC 205515 TaxID=3140791 RepID=UPI003AF3E530